MKKTDLRIKIGSLEMKNPVTVASGTFGYGPEYADLVDLNRLGAITVKGICCEPHIGNATPRTFETASGMLNAIGLPGPGAQGFIEKYIPFLKRFDVPVIVNIWGKTAEDYGRVAETMDAEEGVHALEVNVSCPNVKEGGALYGTDCDLFRTVVDQVRAKTVKPLIVKLAPNVSDIRVFARAAEECGADAVSVMNSYPAMAINIETLRPQLANRTGGLSGPAIKPIAVKLVWEAAQAVQIPIIGMGGISSPEDALEFIIAGATAVAVGTANFSDPSTVIRVIEGMERWMSIRGFDSVEQLRGTVLT
ncbi:MAG: dihydroorotate dehydrogenase catalytic subunit [Verrucomicrobiota bacterium]|jgi:dihydroorotate dehydrogenase (NAD+) catalytic subunit|nr:dihydroorotate dehydrogenase catalytic subunit [Verrucomicrobiota bacterium]MDK2963379.1 dihydroorotate dehydrogenase catalytic subunit [Verrucomicrobiota bacterium]